MKMTSMWQLGHDSVQDWCIVLKTNPALFKMMITKKGLMKIIMMIKKHGDDDDDDDIVGHWAL